MVKIWIHTFRWPSYLSAFLVGIFIFYLGFTYHNGIKIENNWADIPAVSWATINQKIIIDAGHGGVDPGAVGPGGTLEKDITLAISLQLAEILQQSGAEVIMIREDDRDYSTSEKGFSKKKREDLSARAKLVNEAEAQLLISVHVNSFPSAQWSGAQTFYKQDCAEAKELAKSIQDSMIKIMGNTTRKEKPIDSFLLNKIETTGVIVEVGFISNPQEEKNLTNTSYQKQLAWAIFNGISNYLAVQE